MEPTAIAEDTFEGVFTTPSNLTAGFIQIAGTVRNSASALAHSVFNLTIDSLPSQTCRPGPTCVYNLKLPLNLGTPFDFNASAQAFASSPAGSSLSRSSFGINLVVTALDQNGARVPLSSVPEPTYIIVPGLSVLVVLLYGRVRFQLTQSV